MSENSIEQEIVLIQNWIKVQVEQTRTNGVVIGLSGGIDSTVVATLAVNALGVNCVRGILLPCNSSKESITDGWLIAKHLGLKMVYKEDLLKPYKYFHNMFGDKTKSSTNANIKSRLRMIVLYMIANEFNLLVIGTTNKSELLTGYYTKYGDGGTDIEPIADFYKTEVREMAKLLKVPEHIIHKAPAADIGITLTDEEEFSKIIGESITYDEIDAILKAAIDGDEDMPKNISKIKIAGIMKMMQNSEHKRNTPLLYERI
jgi:NAD+ synthase